jgi:hypothetical protein
MADADHVGLARENKDLDRLFDGPDVLIGTGYGLACERRQTEQQKGRCRALEHVHEISFLFKIREGGAARAALPSFLCFSYTFVRRKWSRKSLMVHLPPPPRN